GDRDGAPSGYAAPGVALLQPSGEERTAGSACQRRGGKLSRVRVRPAFLPARGVASAGAGSGGPGWASSGHRVAGSLKLATHLDAVGPLNGVAALVHGIPGIATRKPGLAMIQIVPATMRCYRPRRRRAAESRRRDRPGAPAAASAR